MQVSTPASADLEERARTLLTDCKHFSDCSRFSGAQSNLLSCPSVGKACIEKGSKLDCGGCVGERGNAHCFRQEHGRQSGNVRPVDNENLAPKTGKSSALMTSLLHGVYQAGDGSEPDHSLLSGAEEWPDWLRNDPMLSALFRRFDEIGTEIERRHYAKHTER